jgi:hypothetical protein
MRLAVATPYPEGSTLAVARAAAQTGELEALFTSGYARGTTGWLPARLPVPALQRYRGRRSLPGIPTELVLDCAVRAELARALVSHLPMWQALGSRTMYAAKMAFDRNVARAMPDADVILGIYGSAALTFQAAHRRDVFTVLNFVNSHPAEHNRYLRELAGLRGGTSSCRMEWHAGWNVSWRWPISSWCRRSLWPDSYWGAVFPSGGWPCSHMGWTRPRSPHASPGGPMRGSGACTSARSLTARGSQSCSRQRHAYRRSSSCSSGQSSPLTRCGQRPPTPSGSGH